MKMFRKVLVLLCAVSALAACKDDNPDYPEIGPGGEVLTKGVASFAMLNLDLQTAVNPQAQTKADISTDGFFITVVNAKTGVQAGQWKKSEMPATLELYSGTYTVTATNLLSPRSGVFEQPHYLGSQNFTISENLTTLVGTIVCTQQNMSIQVCYGDAFKNEMTSYGVMVSSSRGNLPIPAAETRLGYFDPVTLTVLMSGVREDGEQIVRKVVISDVAAGYAHVVNFNLTSTGTATLDVTVDMTTNDKPVDVVITDDNTIVDPDPEDPDNPGGDDEPDPVAPTIAGVGFDIAQTMTFSEGTERTVDVNVLAPEGGIQSLKVVIDSPTLAPLLVGIGLGTTLDLTNPSASDKAMLKELGLITDAPIVGEEDFTFSIGSFMPLLPVGTHKFKVDLTDSTGATASETLTIVVTF